MKIRAFLGLAAGFLMIAGAAAHGFTGFLPFQSAFEAATVDAGVIRGAYIGWIWGSFTMAALGLMTLIESSRALREGPFSRPTLGLAGGAYIVFGIWALAISEANPHFLFFILVGALALPASFATNRAG